jgi:UDP-hydrolysing UDP-N-acetyl-D-glucosamine 2-epimerase
VHFPANQDAADRIIRLGEDPAAVHVVGCPRIDLVAEVISNGSAALDRDWLDREGVGGHISTDQPFLLVSQHPVTTEYGQAEHQINETLMALEELKMPTVMLWPNVDAGSEDVSRGMRKFRERCKPEYIRFYKNFPVETFLRLMRSAACLVGNSSSFIREGAFIGTPAVNIGSRQDGRERGANVVDVDYDRAAITAAIRSQVKHGPYPSAHLYGDGKAGARIADLLSTAPLQIQKRIQY